MRFAFLHLLVFMCYNASNAYKGYKSYIAKDIGISHFAHLGGAYAGLLVGIGMLRNYNSSRFKRLFWIFCVAVYCSTMIYGMLMIHCKTNSDKDGDSTNFCNTYQNDVDEAVGSFKNFTINGYNYVKNLLDTSTGNCTVAMQIGKLQMKVVATSKECS